MVSGTEQTAVENGQRYRTDSGTERTAVQNRQWFRTDMVPVNLKKLRHS
jgi:hypothetical protein